MSSYAQPATQSNTLSQAILARFDDGATTPTTTSTCAITSRGYGTCVGRQILTIAGDTVTAVADCAGVVIPGGSAESGTISFSLTDAGRDAATFSGQEDDFGGPPMIIANAVRSEDGLWMVGSGNGDTPDISFGLFTLVQDDGGIPSRGRFTSSAGSTTASDVLPQADGTAWVFGVSAGAFFASHVLGIDGGIPNTGYASPSTTELAVSVDTQLQQASTTHTKLVLDSVGTRLLVGARADAPEVAVAVVEPEAGGFDFASDFAATGHTIAAPAGATALSVGGVAIVPASMTDDYAYVAATLSFDGGSQIGILRLLRHTP